MNDRLDLPESVRQQLAAFRRRLFVLETVFAAGAAVGAVLLSYLVLFVSDRFWETPVICRLLLALACLAAVGGCLWFWLLRWGWRQPDARQLAVLVQKRFPRLGDRLLGIVELADESRRPPHVSPALCRAAMRQVASEAETLDFRVAAPTQPSRRMGSVVAVLAVLVVALLAVLPLAGSNVLQRLVQPFAAVGRYTLVKLEGLSDRRVVPFGEAFDVAARLSPSSRWAPGHARAWFEDQPPVDVPAADGAFRFALPGQTREGRVFIQAGDAREQMRIVPTHRPELSELRLSIRYPAYLGYASATQDVQGGRIELVKGSAIELRSTANRRLREATVNGAALTVEGGSFGAPRQVIDKDFAWRLNWSDVLGLTAREPLTLEFIARADTPPTVACRDLERVVAVLEDEVVEFTVVGEDDFGVRQIGLAWDGSGNAEAGVPPARGALPVATGSQSRRELTGKVQFVPSALGIAPQKITLRATALDYLPGREPSQSSPYTIYVLDRIAHGRLVQQQWERLQEKLEEIARLEESLFEQNQALRSKLPQADAPERLREQAQAEKANAETLQRLQEEGLKLLKEALRNKTISENVLGQWAALLKNLEQIARESMPQVAQSLQRAQSQSDQRESQLKEALTEQQEVLRQLQAALKQMGESGEQLLAASFVNRFRQAAATEQEVARDLGTLMPEIIGLPADRLTLSVKLKVDRVGERQGRNQRNVQEIRDELAGFFNRTRQEKYGKVHDEMVEKHVVEDLERLVTQIAANVAGQSIDQASQWSRQLNGWAEQLAGAAGDGGGNGSGGTAPSAQALELMMRLLRLRQAEEGLRDQTRFLDTHKDQNQYYQPSVGRMASLQRSLVGVAERTGEEYRQPQLAALLDDVQTAMGDAARLLEVPDTGSKTLAAETEAIELLSQTCQQAAGGGRPGAGQSAANSWLAALLRLLGMGSGAGAKGGGSLAGGTTDRPNAPPAGAAAGHAPEPRPVEKASGRDTANLPAEFRQALEAYFKGLEEERK